MPLKEANQLNRTVGLAGATGIGVGAIVGGGILALAGIAFATTGPGAILAFALNGCIAALTALSFAELASSFPESGGPYIYAKKILSAEAAFMVGWVVWLASIVAAALYALGFASYASFSMAHLLEVFGGHLPAWVSGRGGLLTLAVAATLFYSLSLFRKADGGGQWATIGKTVVFGVLVAGGLWALMGEEPSTITARLRPVFPGGGLGLVQAMGFTFIALQGFDLIAAVGGEVKEPQRNIPRAMFYSLGIGLAIYLPLLFIIATVGVDPGESITTKSAQDPTTVMALAVKNYLGSFGFWLVLVAAVLSMLSALQANLLAASRVALTMAQDRSLPFTFSSLHVRKGTPAKAIFVTAVVVVTVLVLVPDVAAAGAVSSLIFLLSFALAHGISILARQRRASQSLAFRTPLFPLVPVVGGLSCVALAFYQGFVVPSAGLVAALWLGVGVGLYFFVFARRATVVDASAEALDPNLLRLRGRTPLVLVPIARPATAAALVEVANALAPPKIGRVLLLSVVQPPGQWNRGALAEQLVDVNAVLRQTLTLSLEAGATPESLTTVASDAWLEMSRVARLHRCESIVLGLGSLSEEKINAQVERLLSTVDSDVIILRAPEGWSLANVRRVLVPSGGRRDQSLHRARLLSSLRRSNAREITYARGTQPEMLEQDIQGLSRSLERLARDEAGPEARVHLFRSDHVRRDLVTMSADYDLVVLGLQRLGRRRRLFGDLTLRLARETTSPLILISGR
jgi:amino acid transporter/nucleotide-binding universal stress UspA family protein